MLVFFSNFGFNSFINIQLIKSIDIKQLPILCIIEMNHFLFIPTIYKFLSSFLHNRRNQDRNLIEIYREH